MRDDEPSAAGGFDRGGESAAAASALAAVTVAGGAADGVDAAEGDGAAAGAAVSPLAAGGEEDPETRDGGAEVAAGSPGGPGAIAPAGVAGGTLAIAGPGIAGPAGGVWLPAAAVTGPLGAAGLVPAGTRLVGAAIGWAAAVCGAMGRDESGPRSGGATWPAKDMFALVGAVAGAACKPACIRMVPEEASLSAPSNVPGRPAEASALPAGGDD